MLACSVGQRTFLVGLMCCSGFGEGSIDRGRVGTRCSCRGYLLGLLELGYFAYHVAAQGILDPAKTGAFFFEAAVGCAW